MIRTAYAEVENNVINTNSIRSTPQEAARMSSSRRPSAIQRICIRSSACERSVPVFAAVNAKGKIVNASIRGTKSEVMGAYAAIKTASLYAIPEAFRMKTSKDLGKTKPEAARKIAERLMTKAALGDDHALKYAGTIGRSYPNMVDEILSLIPQDLQDLVKSTAMKVRDLDRNRNSRTKSLDRQITRGSDLAKIIMSRTKNPDNIIPTGANRSLSTEQAIAFLQITSDEFERWIRRPDGLQPSFLDPEIVESGIIYNRRRWMPEDLMAFMPKIPAFREQDNTPAPLPKKKRKKKAGTEPKIKNKRLSQKIPQAQSEMLF